MSKLPRVRLTRPLTVQATPTSPFYTFESTEDYPWMYAGADSGKAVLIGNVGVPVLAPLDQIQFEEHP